MRSVGAMVFGGCNPKIDLEAPGCHSGRLLERAGIRTPKKLKRAYKRFYELR